MTSASGATASGSTGAISAAPLPSLHSVEKLPDGRFRIPRVPIFAEHVRAFADGTEENVDLPWLVKAQANLKTRATTEKYLPSMHLGHNDPTNTNERDSVGVFEDPTLEQAMFNGKPTWVLFSDLVADNEDDLKKVKKHRYRSVEINRKTKEITGLALLQSRPPYHKFPNLALASYEAADGLSDCFGWPEPLSFADDRSPAAASYANGMPVGTPANPGVGYVNGQTDMSQAPGWAQQILTMLQQLCTVMASPASPPGAQAAPVMQASDPAPSVPYETPATSEDTLRNEAKAKLEAELAAIQKKLSALAAPAPVVTNYEDLAKEVKALTDKLAATKTEDAPATTTSLASYSGAEAVLKFALKAKDGAEAKVRERDNLILWAEKELSDRPLDSAELRTLLTAQYAEGGEVGVQGAVSTLKAYLPSLPGSKAHSDAHEKAPAETKPGDEALAAYADDPEAFEIAKHVQGYWQARPKSRQADTLKDYLDSDPDLAGRAKPVAKKGN